MASTQPRASVLAAAILSLAASAQASDFFVANDGNDGNSGRTISQPFSSVQRAVNAAVAGDTIYLRAGTWREPVTIAKAGTAAAPIVIAAYAGEKPVLKGSAVAAGWSATATAGVWKKTGWSVASQQVFVDGLPQQQIGVPSTFYSGPASDGTTMITPIGTGVADLAPGSFCYVAVEQALYLRLRDGGDPNGHLIEASVLRRILFMDATASHVVVRGIGFRHSSTGSFQVGGAAIELADDCTLDGCDAQWCDFAAVSMGYQRSRSRLIGCTVSNNGDSGVTAPDSRSFEIRGCTVADNNYRSFNTQWHAGGIKATSNAWGTIDSCAITGNRGVGVWFDYAASGNQIVVSANRIENNFGNGAGIMFEASANGVLVDNLIIGNDRRGIYVSASDNVSVWHNVVRGTKTQTAIDISGMPRAGKTLRHIEVMNNIVADSVCQDDLMIVKENGGDILDIRCDYNLFYRTSGTVSLWWGLDGRGGWAGTRYSTVAAWQTAFGTTHSRQADPRLGTGLVPSTDSPAVDAGIPRSAVATDYAGNARIAGATCD
ncbi:MAG: right-handed parallel beta-helix repeat-containing protein, partial [Planctomycetes bacterium]|nr:right-handed parallel beta-helix repeat-containing protein [Planctomycetota bacterium]